MATRWFDGETDLGGPVRVEPPLGPVLRAPLEQYDAHRRGEHRGRRLEAGSSPCATGRDRLRARIGLIAERATQVASGAPESLIPDVSVLRSSTQTAGRALPGTDDPWRRRPTRLGDARRRGGYWSRSSQSVRRCASDGATRVQRPHRSTRRSRRMAGRQPLDRHASTTCRTQDSPPAARLRAPHARWRVLGVE